MIRRIVSSILFLIVASVTLAAVEAVRPQLVETNLDGFGTYAYDGAGNITQVGDDTFDYDTRGRINGGEISGITQTFTYDGWGNITKITTPTETLRSMRTIVSPVRRTTAPAISPAITAARSTTTR